MTRNAFRVFTAVAALSVCALSASAKSDHSTPTGAAAGQTLQELLIDQLRLSTKLEELNMLARNSHHINWLSHAIVLFEVRDVINRASRRLDLLEGGLEPLPPGMRAAAQAIRADLSRIAPEVQALMEEMNEFQMATVRPGFVARVRALAEGAYEAHKTTGRLVRSALSVPLDPVSGD